MDDECPLLKICNSNYYGNYEENDDNVVCDSKIVADNVLYYASVKKINFVRLQLEKANINKYKPLFCNILNKQYQQVYEWMMFNILSDISYNSLVDLISLLEKMDDLIAIKIIGTKNIIPNISIPTTTYDIKKNIIINPDKFHDVVNNLVSFINKYNVNTILSNPITKPVKMLNKYDISTPQWFGTVKVFPKTISADNVQSILDNELEIADYVIKIEKHYCTLANKINEIMARCKHIIDNIL